LQADLATISTNSEHVTSPDSSHYVFFDDPQTVVDALAWVLEQGA
jgi:pimeloyl-ACP methyl ester carboxylesterase